MVPGREIQVLSVLCKWNHFCPLKWALDCPHVTCAPSKVRRRCMWEPRSSMADAAGPGCFLTERHSRLVRKGRFRRLCYTYLNICQWILIHLCTAWCSEIGSLTSLNACNSGAASDAREPISLHQAIRPVLSCVERRQPTLNLQRKRPAINKSGVQVMEFADIRMLLALSSFWFWRCTTAQSDPFKTIFFSYHPFTWSDHKDLIR